MFSEAHATIHAIIVQYPQYTKMHPFGIIISGKTETVKTFQPAVVGMAP
jgi:hypothetical protein